VDYQTFLDEYRRGAVKAHVDKSKAGFMYEDPYLLPRRIRKRQANLRLVAFGGALIGFGSMFWLPWWAGLAIVVAFSTFFPKAQNAAAQGVFEAVLEDAHIYEVALTRGVLCVERVNEAAE
jgi:hypothetical protein